MKLSSAQEISILSLQIKHEHLKQCFVHGIKMQDKEDTVTNREELLAKIIEFAAMAFNKDAATINENTNISEELGVASSQRVAMCSLRMISMS